VLKLDPRVLGPRVGADVQKLLRAAKEGDYEVRDDGVVLLGRQLAEDEYELVLQGGTAGTRVVPETSAVVVLDLVTTPELEAEGTARDIVRGVNDARRAAGLDVSDRIRLVVDVGGHDDVADALRAHEDFVLRETLATELVLPDEGHHRPGDAHRVELPDGRVVHLTVSPTHPRG
jgi:isoleucyl-tRNA synthetase